MACLDTLSLENSISRSRTLAYLAMVALKALETGELEARVAALEGAVAARPARPPSVFDIDPNDGSFEAEEVA